MFSIRHTPEMRRQHSSKGFTLIELLVVMLIILILMAALMPVYSKILLKAKKEATQGMIGTLAASLERYNDAFDSYPPNSASGDDDGTLYDYLNGKNGRGVAANVGTPREKHFEPFLTLGKEYIKASTGGDKLIIVDSWGMPIHYFNCKAFVQGSGDSKLCHNPTSVDIYSTGPDKLKDATTSEPGKETVPERGKLSPAEKAKSDDISNF